MSFKFFTISLREVSSGESELNAFLGSHRVLGVDRQFVDVGANSFWALCVEYLPGVAGATAAAFDKKGRIDYREVLPPEDFLVFVKLRDLRKQMAQAEAVPVYTIFTNDQLAEMVRRRLHTLADLSHAGRCCRVVRQSQISFRYRFAADRGTDGRPNGPLANPRLMPPQ